QNTSANLSTIATQEGQNQTSITERFDRDPLIEDPKKNAVFVPIRHTDIDLKSGAAESALNQKVHANIGAVFPGEVADIIIGAGVFADMPHKNSTLKMWGAWAKFGTTF
ncbi:unnamed protein product, partial [marine sediment metagenome]